MASLNIASLTFVGNEGTYNMGKGFLVRKLHLKSFRQSVSQVLHEMASLAKHLQNVA